MNLPHHDSLINLSADVPTFFGSRFACVAEIVTQDELQLSIAVNALFYQERGYDIKINDMKSRMNTDKNINQHSVQPKTRRYPLAS